MRNLYKYTKFYSGQEPEFIEGDIFKTIVPLDEAYSSSVSDDKKATIKSDDKKATIKSDDKKTTIKTLKRYEEILEFMSDGKETRTKELQEEYHKQAKCDVI